MRLLNSSTLQLEEFPPNQVPTYAILSHTWSEDEVLFADMKNDNPTNKAGYAKIRYSCEQAASEGLQHVWIDTCCIDKSSSAELSEAINSMYTWYQRAQICYAYLADVSEDVDARSKDSAFGNSRWFTRGWTLQELIAPSDLVFYSNNWIKIGTKQSLHNVISEITGIDVDILTGVKGLESASIAKRMSWASRRATTRVEDIAYSLMGIFGVNMPMLYGEGEKSFRRLQEEIMKDTGDMSLFAWTDLTAPENSTSGLLAISPAEFFNSGNIFHCSDWKDTPPSEFNMTNRGLSIALPLVRTDLGQLVAASLDCPIPPHYEESLGIYLKCISARHQQYTRLNPQKLCKVSSPREFQSARIYVRQSTVLPEPRDIYPKHIFQLYWAPDSESRYKMIGTIPYPLEEQNPPCFTFPCSPSAWIPDWEIPDTSTFTFTISKRARRLAGVLLLQRDDGERLVVMLGSTTDLGVGFDAACVSRIGSFEEFEGLYNPQSLETLKYVESHCVRCIAKFQIQGGTKFYMVSVRVIQRSLSNTASAQCHTLATEWVR